MRKGNKDRVHSWRETKFEERKVQDRQKNRAIGTERERVLVVGMKKRDRILQRSKRKRKRERHRNINVKKEENT